MGNAEAASSNATDSGWRCDSKRGRKKIATWISRGKKQTAELNKKGDRIRQESGCWIACYTGRKRK